MRPSPRDDVDAAIHAHDVRRSGGAGEDLPDDHRICPVELDDAKRELAGSFPLSTASNADIVGQLGAIGFYDLPLTYLEDFMAKVQALDVAQVKAAMARHLSPDQFVIVTAGPTVAQKELPPPTDKPADIPSGVPEH